MSNIDLTLVQIGRTKVMYKGIPCVFTSVTQLFDRGRNFEACLLDVANYNRKLNNLPADVNSVARGDSINTGQTYWYILERDCEPFPNSILFIQND